MENEEKKMTENESLELINRMINSTRRNLKEDSVRFLFWGYLVLGACALNFALDMAGYGDKSGWLWLILMSLGGIYSGITGYRNRKKQKVKTHIDRIMGYVWSAFGISFIVIWFVIGSYMYNNSGAIILFLPMIMMLYGIGTFVSGGLLQFSPLVWGGVSCWLLAIASVCFLGTDATRNMEIQFLFISFSLITGYIIPGHLLRKATYNN